MTDASRALLVVDDLLVCRGRRKTRLRRKDDLVHAVDGVSFSVQAGESFGIVGESGCGKTTLALALLRLLPAQAGRVLFDEVNLLELDENALRPFRRQLQVVFQDPYSSLHPRKRISKILEEPFELHTSLTARDRRLEALKLLDQVGLGPRFADHLPRNCSGGQRQRIAIARALALRPRLLILDEPVSALDVSIRAQIMQLLARLQSELGLTYVFISHDLALVRSFCHSLAVMYLGRIVEQCPVSEVLSTSAHPYTRSLLEAVPIPDPDVEEQRTRREIRGEVPSATRPPPGCKFHPRCAHARPICEDIEPPLEPVSNRAVARCHFWREVKAMPPEMPMTAGGRKSGEAAAEEQTPV